MFENQTYEAILERMFKEISNEIDKREGSVAHDMLSPKAIELALVYMELDNVLNFGFAGTTYGEFLDLKVNEAGIMRLPAAQSQGKVIFTGETEGYLIPKGTVISTETGISFETDNHANIIGGSVEVDITAIEGGVRGDVPANSITSTTLPNVSVTNPQPTGGGAEIETDEALLSRYYKKVRQPAISGNANHYMQWALEVPGVGDAKIEPLWDGRGTVKVVIISPDKTPVTVNKVEEVAAYIETVRPIGATVTVQSAVEKPINISTDITLAEGHTVEQVLPTIEQKLSEYFKDVTFVESDIKLSIIGMILLGTDGIVDYRDLRLNDEAENVNINYDEIPVIGEVTFN